jgi:hypothetical protein
LFKPASSELKAKFSSIIPAYPDNVYDFYRLDRFLSPGISVPDRAEWNRDISVMLNDRGARKQVNLIVVAAKTDDANYEHALKDAWQGANKNDVVIVLGTPEYPRIDWVRVVTWSKSEIFKIELRDQILGLGSADRDSVISVAAEQIDKNFVRRSMKEFEYLEGEIDPPTWILVTLLLLQIAAAAGVQYYVHTRFYTPGRPRRSFSKLRIF